MTDIVQRLREYAHYTTTTYHDALIQEAADEIERLRLDNARTGEREAESIRIIQRLRAASHDERLSTGMLYREAIDEIERLNTDRTGLKLALNKAESEIQSLRNALHEIAEEWAGAECGEPVHAQEAYAIQLAKRMYSLAAEALK